MFWKACAVLAIILSVIDLVINIKNMTQKNNKNK